MKNGGESYKQRVSDAITDHIYVRPQTEMLEGYAGRVWRYEYRHVLSSCGMGAFHASELPVLFGLNDFFWKADDPASKRIGHELRNIWGVFARTGTAKWRGYNEDDFIQRIGGN